MKHTDDYYVYITERTKRISTLKRKLTHMLGSLRHCCQLSIKRKLCWFRHVSRNNTLAKTIQQGKIEGAIPRCRPKMEWMDTIFKWTSKDLGDLLIMTND